METFAKTTVKTSRYLHCLREKIFDCIAKRERDVSFHPISLSLPLKRTSFLVFDICKCRNKNIFEDISSFVFVFSKIRTKISSILFSVNEKERFSSIEVQRQTVSYHAIVLLLRRLIIVRDLPEGITGCLLFTVVH